MSDGRISTQCCIAGGGPAGIMLGLLLARAGIDVVVLEKHADFLRDFRGDTIHPSTLELMHELGLLDRLLELPHQKVDRITMRFGDATIRLANFRRLPTRCGFIAFMPQWDFLTFLSEKAGRYPGFTLMMETEATALIEKDGRVRGVRAASGNDDLEVRADLTVAADGRHSTLRALSGLAVRDFGAPMDVLWFSLPRREAHGDPPLARFGRGHILVLIDRGEHWQCGYVIPKGGNERIRAAGLAAFRDHVAGLAPFLAGELAGLRDWDAISLLSVQVNRLEKWHRPGLLCIGDAAHAMSPIAGVGINLAIQDAVCAANVLAGPLADGAVDDSVAARIQARRLWPTAATQRLQLLIQKRVIFDALRRDRPITPPLLFRLFDRFAPLRRIPGRLIGMGVRPEHVGSAAAPLRQG